MKNVNLLLMVAVFMVFFSVDAALTQSLRQSAKIVTPAATATLGIAIGRKMSSESSKLPAVIGNKTLTTIENSIKEIQDSRDSIIESSSFRFTYKQLLDKAQNCESYGQAEQFIKEHCSVLDSGLGMSEKKLNQLTALIEDLQLKNNKQIQQNKTEQLLLQQLKEENQVFQSFNDRLLKAQRNRRDEIGNKLITKGNFMINYVIFDTVKNSLVAIVNFFKD
ncbi:hypothetical protein KBC04_02460 [Candidatus Babeliales bacterium]|nr:hypothetical protein [Candidatus Babeliales bacterium]MBP9843728.1 hypothetical protein [Candidatus Babeliales bacterium]